MSWTPIDMVNIYSADKALNISKSWRIYWFIMSFTSLIGNDRGSRCLNAFSCYTQHYSTSVQNAKLAFVAESENGSWIEMAFVDWPWHTWRTRGNLCWKVFARWAAAVLGIVDVSFDLMSPHDVIGLNSLRTRNAWYCAQLVAVLHTSTQLLAPRSK